MTTVTGLRAGGAAAAWCRGVARATRDVHRVDAGLAAVCSAAPRRPRVATGPLLGSTLPRLVDRPVPEPPADDPAAATRRTRREEAARRDLVPPPADCPPGARPRPAPVPPPATPHPPGRIPRPAAWCPPDGATPGSAHRPPPAAGSRVPVGRLRAWAGPDLRPGSAGLASAGPAKVAREERPRRTPPAVAGVGGRPVAPAALLTGHVADRLARRIGASSAEALGGLARTTPRATGATPDLTRADLRALAAPATQPDDQAPTPPPESRAPEDTPRRRTRRRPGEVGPAARRQSTAPESGHSAARRPAEDAAAVPPSTGPTPRPLLPDPIADRTVRRELSRFAEQPIQPPRLGGGPLSDDTAAARGEAWTGTGRATPDVRASSTAVGLSEPDLELLMTRVLDDAARRHGIEV